MFFIIILLQVLFTFLNIFLSLLGSKTRKTIKRQVSQFQRHLQTFYAALRDKNERKTERERRREREGASE